MASGATVTVKKLLRRFCNRSYRSLGRCRQRVNRMRGFRQWRWHLDEMYVKLNGELIYLWRAVDHEGEILESYVMKKRDKSAALAFIKKALKRHGRVEKIVVRPGAKVQPDTIILELSSPDLEQLALDADAAAIADIRQQIQILEQGWRVWLARPSSERLRDGISVAIL